MRKYLERTSKVDGLSKPQHQLLLLLVCRRQITRVNAQSNRAAPTVEL
jgi:hypothetical protein